MRTVATICLLALLSQSTVYGSDFEITCRKYVRAPSEHFFEKTSRARRVHKLQAATEPKQSTAQPLKIELDPEKGPEIRVALATDTTSASISSNQPLTAYDPVEETFVGLDTLQVKVQLDRTPVRERPGQLYRVQVVGLRNRNEADSVARDIERQFDEKVEKRYDSKSSSYQLSVGEYYSPHDAQTMMVRLKDAGYRTTSLSRDRNVWSPSTTLSAVTPRGERLISSPDRLTLAPSTDAFLQFNGKPYRGRFEVTVNKRGRLNVINVLQMEDYVRGVVPNELSPSGFPQLEAIKAQAIAARTYAIRNKGQFASEGYDLLPTALSQVYGGMSTEHALSDRAVAETAGVIATYDGKPINALYTSTCGGRTESSENVFSEAVPYLVSVACAPQHRARRTVRGLKTDRQIEPVFGDYGRQMARDIALLSVLGFQLPEEITSSYLQATATSREIERWLARASELLKRGRLELPEKLNTLTGFAEGLNLAIFASDSPANLLADADADYILGREAKLPERARTVVAALIQEGILTLAPDGSLKEQVTRSAALTAILKALARFNQPALETGTARPVEGGRLRVKMANRKEPVEVELARGFYMFRSIQGEYYPARTVEVVGGEKVSFHRDESGRIDYLEVQLNPNGAASDRFSVYSRWETRYTASELRARLAEAKVNVGEILDLQPLRYGISNRLAEMRIVGSERERVLTGFRIRSALGLRESLFIIQREYSESGGVIAYRFIGRGWGHGVGMCQVGAYGLALEGLTYEQILKRYYTGIELTRLY